MRGRVLLVPGVLLLVGCWFATTVVTTWGGPWSPVTVADPPPAAVVATGAATTGSDVRLDRQLVAESDAMPPVERRELPSPLRDVVVLDQSGRGIGGATVGVDVVFRADGEQSSLGGFATTDADGRACMVLPAGSCLSACAPGFGIASQLVPSEPGAMRVVLTAALRLEITVQGPLDFRGFHVRVLLPPDCKPGPCYQSTYEQTPGRAVDGTVARYGPVRAADSAAWSTHPAWELALRATGMATLDQIEGIGTATVQLLHCARLLEERQVVMPAGNGRVQVQFATPPQPLLRGTVVDHRGLPLAGALLRMSPYGGCIMVDDPGTGDRGFPVWAPRTVSDADGCYALPCSASADERVVITCAGHAARVRTIGELAADAGRIALEHGCTVRLEAVDCNGAPLHGGWTTGGREYAEPSVLLDHDVWRGTGCDELPWFQFPELPLREVTFRCAGELLRHDARVPWARLVTAAPVDELGIGK